MPFSFLPPRWRRWRGPWRRSPSPWGRIRFLYDPAYRLGLTGVPMDALRGERILAWLEQEGWIDARDRLGFRPASLEALTRAHSPAYLRSLEDPTEVSWILGLPLEPPAAVRALEMQRVAAGGTLEGVRHVLRNGGVAFHLGGGFHHASPGRGTGFCLLNDVTIAIRAARSRGFRDPILVVDLDVHDGNGTRVAFSDDPSVYTVSLHNQTWDLAPAVADTTLAYGPGVTDAQLLGHLSDVLPRVFREHAPKLTIYVAGVDPLAGDAYGDGQMTLDGLFHRDRYVLEWVRRAQTPLVHVLAGGYGGGAWRPTARLAAWMLTGTQIDPPDDVEVALRRAQQEGAPRSGTASDPFVWSFSADDVEGFGIVTTPAPGDVLRADDREKIARELERFGILAQIRNRGYESPLVEVASDQAFGPAVRIWGEPDRETLLMEVRFGMDRRALQGVPLLKVEWLLLQDPRARFSDARAPLPGQAHPGLGILADVVAWLVALCEERGLRGILFRTSHFHVVALAERRLHFLRAEDRDRYLALLSEGEGGLGARSRAIEAAGLWPDTDAVVPVGKGWAEQTYPARRGRVREAPPRERSDPDLSGGRPGRDISE